MRKAVLEFKTRIGDLSELEEYEQDSENGSFMPDMEYLKMTRVIVLAREILNNQSLTDEETLNQLNNTFFNI
jgi:hypothetical protein